MYYKNRRLLAKLLFASKSKMPLFVLQQLTKWYITAAFIGSGFLFIAKVNNQIAAISKSFKLKFLLVGCRKTKEPTDYSAGSTSNSIFNLFIGFKETSLFALIIL